MHTHDDDHGTTLSVSVKSAQRERLLKQRLKRTILLGQSGTRGMSTDRRNGLAGRVRWKRTGCTGSSRTHAIHSGATSGYSDKINRCTVQYIVYLYISPYRQYKEHKKVLSTVTAANHVRIM